MSRAQSTGLSAFDQGMCLRECPNLRPRPHGIGRSQWRNPMTDSSRAAGQVQIYKRYSHMARQATNGEQRRMYQCLAREALRQAAKLDPAAVARASALAVATV